MPEMHLKQPDALGKPGFTDSACGPFTKHKERIQKFKETGNTKYIYKNKLDKACFEHGITHGDFKDLPKRTASGKILRDNSFNIEKIQNMVDIKEFLLLWFTVFLIKKTLHLQINLFQVVELKIKLNKINKLQMNFINQLSKHLRKQEFIHHVKARFTVLILQIFN